MATWWAGGVGGEAMNQTTDNPVLQTIEKGSQIKFASTSGFSPTLTVATSGFVWAEGIQIPQPSLPPSTNSKFPVQKPTFPSPCRLDPPQSLLLVEPKPASRK